MTLPLAPVWEVTKERATKGWFATRERPKAKPATSARDALQRRLHGYSYSQRGATAAHPSGPKRRRAPGRTGPTP